MGEIDLNKNIGELLREYPGLARFLAERGIDCANCLGSQVDTLPEVARMYHLDLRLLMEQMSPTDADGSARG